jgi:hypothetical protein
MSIFWVMMQVYTHKDASEEPAVSINGHNYSDDEDNRFLYN